MSSSNFLMLVGAAVAIASLSGEARAGDTPARGPIPFSVFDQNGDGVISQDEFDAVRAERMAKRGEEASCGMGKCCGEGKGCGTGKGQGCGKGRGGQPPTFEEFDRDGDGFIVEEEFYEFRNQRIAERAKQGYPMKNLDKMPTFSDLDLDGDGKLSPEEFEAHREERRRSGSGSPQ